MPLLNRNAIRNLSFLRSDFSVSLGLLVARMPMQQYGFITLERPLELLRLSLLFAITALAEIVGCYLPWLVLRQGKSLLLLIPAAASLALFAWLLTLHPTAAGRTYAAYGGMYIAVALLWLKFVDGVSLTRWDALGATIALIGMAVIALQPSAA